MSDGNCARLDDDTMFPNESDARGVAAALAVCDGCPVRLQCLAFALEHDEQHGIWGGVVPSERAAMQRRQQRHARRVR